jgi:uncharacterized OB-fold protein
MPQRKSVPLAWRRFQARYRLVGSKCKKCGKIYFPPRVFCKKCGNGELEEYKLKEEGKVHTFTIIHVAPSGFEHRVPYCIGIIELEDGVKITGEIVGEIEKVKIGSKVRAVFRKIFEDGKDGIIHYGLKWELVE